MGDRIGKGLQFPVGGLQFGGALNDALLQFGVESLDFFLRLLVSCQFPLQILHGGIGFFQSRSH